MFELDVIALEMFGVYYKALGTFGRWEVEDEYERRKKEK